MKNYDVIVIGGGHAGTEAASASARLGANTLLLTHKYSTIGEMSCNPAIGGIAKGTLVREIDAMDGVMGRAIDRAGIHYRMLNQSKGPAVRGPRAQADRKLYRLAVQDILANQSNLTIIEDAADEILIEDGRITGVGGASGTEYRAASVVLTTGTFLRGLIHLGEQKTSAGRVGEAPSIKLSDSLHKIGFAMGRLKTGTPARLNGKTIDWSACTPQPGDNPPRPFSFLTERVTISQISCFITETNEKTHSIIRENIHRSPMYSGQIGSRGPRYCPSIEDKVVRFADKARHQVFLEPEGLDDDTVYPNGISTSLPAEVQDALIHSIAGLEKVEIIRPGYAIEYDCVDARELKHTLETKKILGLFFAGQINGTTGYEEAGAQGLIAGLNAALLASGSAPFILDRADGYTGVMIDDLVTLGTNEPYRMFTSRSEYRLSLRPDNADMRLTEKIISVGGCSPERKNAFETKLAMLNDWRHRLSQLTLTPSEASKAGLIMNQDGIRRDAIDLLRYPTITWHTLTTLWPILSSVTGDIREQLEIEALYRGYMDRQTSDVAQFRQEEGLFIPPHVNYDNIASLSTEVREKLKNHRPETIGEASKISGVTPAAVLAVLAHIKRKSA